MGRPWHTARPQPLGDPQPAPDACCPWRSGQGRGPQTLRESFNRQQHGKPSGSAPAALPSLRVRIMPSAELSARRGQAPSWEACPPGAVTLQKGNAAAAANSPGTHGLKKLFVVRPEELTRAQMTAREAAFPVHRGCPLLAERLHHAGAGALGPNAFPANPLTRKEGGQERQRVMARAPER